MKNTQKAIDKYLRHYATSSLDLLCLLETLCSPYDEAVIVPIYDESLFYFHFLESLNTAAEIENKKVLLVSVLNRHSDSPIHVMEDNEYLFRELSALVNGLKTLSGFGRSFYGKYTPYLDIVLLDASSSTTLLPAKKGVGLARKMAADICLALYQQGKILSPWLKSSDADVLLPEDYFINADLLLARYLSYSAGLGQECVGITYPYVHSAVGAQANLATAINYYDAYLKYYPEKLKQVGSPYAFHAIGSILMFHLPAYAQVRGFPERSAAEDFYLLNKLAKIGKIATISTRPIQISGRISQRTPIGTGRSIAHISALLEEKTEYLIYHPMAFQYLKKFLHSIYHIISAQNRSLTVRTSEYLPLSIQYNSDMYEYIVQLLTKVEFPLMLNKVRSGSCSIEQGIRDFHCRFDALKTQQFLKACCQHMVCYIPAQEMSH